MKEKAKSTPIKTIDWSKIPNRLKQLEENREIGFEPTSVDKKRILQLRSRALAEDIAVIKLSEEEYIEIAGFLLSYEKYALEIKYIQEACPLKELTKIPGTPTFILGVMNFHGHILPVIDLRNFFDLPIKGLTELNKVMVLRHSGIEVGILADELLEVSKIPLNEIQSSLPTLSGIRTDYLKGITKDRIVILDALKLLSDDKIRILE